MIQLRKINTVCYNFVMSYKHVALERSRSILIANKPKLLESIFSIEFKCQSIYKEKCGYTLVNEDDKN